MLTYESNIGEVSARLSSELKSFEAGGANSDILLRAVAVSALSEIKVRVHRDGTNSKGTPIGTYSNSYLARRQKAPYNRTGDSKVIFSLTRNMENDLTVTAGDNGSYDIGFNNPDNAKKADWLQNGTKATTVKAHRRDISKRTKKGAIRKGESERIVNVKSHSRKGFKGFGKVYNLTEQERTLLLTKANEIINQLFNK